MNYELYDKDSDHWLRIGQAAFASDAEAVANDTSRDWSERIRAAAEFIYRERIGGNEMPKGQNGEIKVNPNRRKSIYIACEELDFTWGTEEAKTFDAMWEAGASVREIAKALGRDVDEVAILTIDRSRKGKIKPRQGGAMGVQYAICGN